MSDAVNPFDAPESDPVVAQGGIGSLDLVWLLFSFEGRINRRQYWLVYAIYLVAIVVFVLLMIPVTAVLPVDSAEFVVGLLLFVMMIPFLWTNLATRVKRWHDLGYSGWACFVAVIPYVGGIIEGIAHYLMPGNTGPNQYGHPPVGFAPSRPFSLDDDLWDPVLDADLD